MMDFPHIDGIQKREHGLELKVLGNLKKSHVIFKPYKQQKTRINKTQV